MENGARFTAASAGAGGGKAGRGGSSSGRGGSEGSFATATLRAFSAPHPGPPNLRETRAAAPATPANRKPTATAEGSMGWGAKLARYIKIYNSTLTTMKKKKKKTKKFGFFFSTKGSAGFKSVLGPVGPALRCAAFASASAVLRAMVKARNKTVSTVPAAWQGSHYFFSLLFLYFYFKSTKN